MMYRVTRLSRTTQALPVAALLLALVACGGVDTAGTTTANQDATSADQGASSVQSLSITLSSPAEALPQFHVAPVVLAPPADTDVLDPAASAMHEPHIQTVSAELAPLSTRRLTHAAMESVLRDGSVPDEFAADAPGATPLDSGTAVATYTPAQIRTAYGLPALPAVGTTLTSQQAAQMGAGQTIYIVDAQDDPNAAAELATFDQQFGLPACSVTSIATNASLPLPAAATDGCSFSVVYSTSAGSITSSAPSYDSEWATEIALDVQWTHATAPLARIILIEAPDASADSLAAAVTLANAMGPGVVSMSFGAPEGEWTPSFDSTFSTADMTYVAAAGDAGAGVNWPAVSAHVLAVGGSTLTYTGVAPRSEIVWSNTGGGVSQYTPTPSYQNRAVPGIGTPAHRSVSDVSFNADPTTGQYLAVLAQGATTVDWLSAGGTSLSTPQWAAIIAVANALRAQAELPALGDAHADIYSIAGQSGSYASAFDDITVGSDGSCASCFAEVGYDLPTGIGTPNVTSLLSALVAAPASSAPPVSAPLVSSASISGTSGSPLSFAVSVTAVDPLTYALANAPAGMSINASGVVSWGAPVTGTFAVTVGANDSKTGLSGRGVYTVTIQPAPPPPVVASASLSGTVGTALVHAVSVTDANPVSLTLSGAPSGMTISAAGVLSWPTPVIGAWSVTVSARDTKTALIGRGVLTITIEAAKAPSAPAAGPVITASKLTGVAGKALSGTISVADKTSKTLHITVVGAPRGVILTATGNSLAVRWASPVTGSYKLMVTAKDGNGRTASLSVPITIAAH